MFRLTILILFILLNIFACTALVRTVRVWVRQPKRRRIILWCFALIVTVLNIPIVLFFYRSFDPSQLGIPLRLLQMSFYPTMAWLVTVLFFFVLVGPPALMLTLARAVARPFIKRPSATPDNDAPAAVGDKPGLSRREFLAGSAGLLIPPIYGVAAYGIFGNLDELEITAEHAVPIPYLPSSLEGMTIVQISDLHVGPYLREKELRYIVSRTNELHPDLVVITGDTIDRNLESLPDAVRGLAGIKSTFGAFAVLGNHDITSDRSGYSSRVQGGINIAQGLESIGIRTLRNEAVYLGSRQDRVALLGLDWLSHGPGRRDFFAYQQTLTRQQLNRMVAETGPETPSILLAHHPDTFADALPYKIGLTLAGHTHGGGQVILGSFDRIPIGLGMFRFRYLSGLYQEQSCSLYVNRGIGYLGIPVRINCPPEISRFKLVRTAEGVVPRSPGRSG
jgi:predicted MPP superfamily phosphohydrolase